MTTATIHSDKAARKTSWCNSAGLRCRPPIACLKPRRRLKKRAPGAGSSPSRTTKTSTSHRGSCPRALRPHFHAIYAYCRISDDLGDEVGDTAQALALLDMWGRELDACYEGRARHPVFVALAETIRVVLHSQGALRRSAHRLPAGSDGDPLRDDAGRARLLPLLRQSRRPPRALRLRLCRRGALPALRCHLFRPATGKLLAGRARGLRQGPRLSSAGRHAALRRPR